MGGRSVYGWLSSQRFASSTKVAAERKERGGLPEKADTRIGEVVLGEGADTPTLGFATPKIEAAGRRCRCPCRQSEEDSLRRIGSDGRDSDGRYGCWNIEWVPILRHTMCVSPLITSLP